MFILLLTTVFATTCIVRKHYTDNTCTTLTTPEVFTDPGFDETCRIVRNEDEPESTWRYSKAICENGEPTTYWGGCTTDQCLDEDDPFCDADGTSFWSGECQVVPLGRGTYYKFVCETCEDLPCGYMNVDGTPANPDSSCTESPTTSPTTAPTWAEEDIETGCIVKQLYSDETCETQIIRGGYTLGYDSTCLHGGLGFYAKGTCTYAPDGTAMSMRVSNLCSTDQCLDEGDYSCGVDGQDYSETMDVCRHGSLYPDTYQKYLCQPCDQLTCDVKGFDGTTQLNPNAAEDPVNCATDSAGTFSLVLAVVAAVLAF